MLEERMFTNFCWNPTNQTLVDFRFRGIEFRIGFRWGLEELKGGYYLDRIWTGFPVFSC